MRAWAFGILIVASISVACFSWLGVYRLHRISVLERDVDNISKHLDDILSEVDQEDQGTSSRDELRFRSLVEAEQMFAELGKNPTATQLSKFLVEIDGWLTQPDEETRFEDFKLNVAKSLREQVKQEVRTFQQRALKAATGKEGSELYAKAGQILALYPMADDETVLDEAKMLAVQQAEVAVRIESLRRQRYNQWAATQIESAINDYNRNSSYWSPRKENKMLIDAMIKNLGEIDPGLMEPVVLELYNYIIDRTRNSISEKDKTDLAKRLTEPTINRKTLGDF